MDDIFNNSTSSFLNCQPKAKETFKFPSSIGSKMDLHSSLELSQMGSKMEEQFFTMEDQFTFPSKVQDDSDLTLNRDLSILFDEPRLKKAISKPKSERKEARRVEFRKKKKLDSPAAKRKRLFASKFSKAKETEFSLEACCFEYKDGDSFIGETEFLKSKSKPDSESSFAKDSLPSTQINSRKSSNDKLATLNSPIAIFDPPSISNFPIEKLKKIAKAFKFGKCKKSAKPKDSLKERIKSFSPQERRASRVSSHITDIMKFSKNLNTMAGSECQRVQNGIDQMFQKVEEKKVNYQIKVEEVKLKKFKSLLNF